MPSPLIENVIYEEITHPSDVLNVYTKLTEEEQKDVNRFGMGTNLSTMISAFVAYAGRLSVGFAIAHDKAHLKGNTVFISVAMLPDYREAYHADKLLRFLIVKLKLVGFSEAQVYVSKTNIAAIGLFEGVGFKQIRTSSDGSIVMSVDL